MEAELKNDRLRVRYHPATVTLDQMLEAIREQGFHGQVVPPSTPAGPP